MEHPMIYNDEITAFVDDVKKSLELSVRQAIIISGLPGSGKTTIRDVLPSISKCVSADLAMTVNGVYRFDRAKLPRAHNECLLDYVEFLRVGEKIVVVDNTNISESEIAPYYRLAEAFGYYPVIVRLHCDVKAAYRRNIHRVPAVTIMSMYQKLLRLELPPWWNQRIIFTD